MRKKNNFIYLLYILGIIVLTLLVFLTGWEEVKEVVSRVSTFNIAVLFSLQLVTIFLTGYMWHFLINRCNEESSNDKVSLNKVMGIHLAGSFVESVTPSVKLGGEAAKIYLMRRSSLLSYQQLTAITLVTKYFSLLPFVFISFLILVYTFVSRDFPTVVYFSFIGLVFTLILFILFFKLDLVGAKTKKLFDSLRQAPCERVPGGSAFSRPGSTWRKLSDKAVKVSGFLKEASQTSRGLTNLSDRWKLILIGFSVWLFYPAKVYLAALMLDFNPDFFLIAVATFTAYLVNMLPLLPGGLGSFEGSMALVFVYAGFSGAEGLSIALVTRFITFWLPLVLSAIAALMLVYNRDKPCFLKDDQKESTIKRN